MACLIDQPAARSDDVPLVLLHGFPMDGRVWDDVAAITSGHWRTLRPDFPGFGKSPAAPFTIDTLADDLRELLARLDALPAVVAGLSMGGYVALALARRHPRDLAGLALVDSRANADDATGQRKRDQMIKLAGRGGAAAVVEHMHPNMLAEATYSERPDIALRLRQIMLDTPAETIALASAAMRDRPDQQELLGQIDIPVAVIVGALDAITPPSVSEQMAQSIRGAELSVIPDAGHLSPIERPREVAAALDRLMVRAVGRR